jgi:hypothetical protein
MSWTRIILAVLGAGLALHSLNLLLRSPTRRFLALIWLAIAGTLALAAWNPAILRQVETTSFTVRMRLATGLLSFLVLMITLEAVRRTAMQERYALLWVFTGCILLLFAIYPNAIAWLVALTGMHYVSAIVVVVFGFLILVAFDFSLALSRLREKQKATAQYAALVEKRLRDLEKRVAEAATAPDAGEKKPAAGLAARVGDPPRPKP